MMALLRQADFAFEAKHLLTVFAELAVHQIGAAQDLLDPFCEAVQHGRMVLQIGRLDELDLRMTRGNQIGVVVNSLHQDAGKEKVGKDDDAAIAKLYGMLQPRLDQRKGDAGIAGLAPTEAKAFPEQAHDLGDIGIGVGVRCAPAHHHEQGLGHGDVIAGRGQGLLDAVAGGLQHLGIDGELAAVVNLHGRVLGLVGGQDGGDVVFCVAGGKQHARHGEHLVVARVAKLV